MPSDPARSGLFVLSLLTTYIVWGATFLAIRWAVEDVPPFLLIGIRCAAGAVILVAWLWWKGPAIRPSSRDLRTAAVAGTLMFVGCHGLLAWAEQRVPSGTAALYLTAIPIWLVAITSVSARRAPSMRTALGLGFGVLGVAMLSAPVGSIEAGNPLDRIALIASGFAWAAGSLVAARGTHSSHRVASLAMQLVFGGALVLALSVGLGEWTGWAPGDVSGRAWASVAFLVLGGTVLGLVAYTWLLHNAPPAAAGSYAFANPVVALVLAVAVGDQTLTTRTWTAGGVVLLAVALTMERTPRCSRNRRPARRGQTL